MADDKTSRAFWVVLRDAAVALGVDIAFKEFTKVGFKKAADVIDKKVSKDQRAALLEDLRQMPIEDKKNLIAWHRKAKRNFKEDRFVTLLCKIPKDPTQGRRPTLKYLNGLDEKEFNQMLYLLEHDVIVQWMQTIWHLGGRITKKEIKQLKDLLAASKQKAREFAEKMDPVAGKLAGHLRKLNNHLEQKQNAGRFYGERRPWYCRLGF